jgi:tyrosyl-tRNA synthetase
MHMVEDDLKNPCLDYVEHIVLAPPNSTFSAGGKTYADFASCKADFVAGTLSEAGLKDGLVESINLLLEPVRAHFARNEAGQKDLLERIQGYKRDPVKATVGKSTTRMGISEDAESAGPWQKSGKPIWAVFAPFAEANDKLGSVLSTLRQLRAAPADHEVVLWMSDWGSRVLNKVGGDAKPDNHIKNVNAAQTLFIAGLKAIDALSASKLGLAAPTMERVHVVTQSAAILSDPSGYWISVINVGRLFKLVRCAISDRLLHLRMPLDPTHVRFK